MSEVTIGAIYEVLERLGGWNSVCIPEFTWGDLRVDAAVVDLRTRWIRGFEIKMSRADFQRDEKWILYSRFCSSLSIVCPHGLIKPEEVEKPFGLLWVGEGSVQWAKKPKNLQKREAFAWLWTYMNVIERENFRDLWNSLNTSRGFGWEKNPWVWVLEFKRVK